MDRHTPELPADLDALRARVRSASCAAALADAELAYALALLARAATGRSLPSGGAVEACARSLGFSRQKLQSHAAIATRWTPQQFRGLLQRGVTAGGRLSTSHLLLIASLPRSLGEQWVERILQEGWSASEVKERLKQCRRPVAPPARLDASPPEAREWPVEARASGEEADAGVGARR